MWTQILQPFAPTDARRARQQPWLLILLATTIPAFYLVLAGTEPWHWLLGRTLYAASGVGLGALLLLGWRGRASARVFLRANWLDLLIAGGILASSAGGPAAWTHREWVLRLTLVALIACRLGFGFFARFAPVRVLGVVTAGVVTMLLAGAGFYLLEPSVSSFADGIWLAFTSGATVGYGDLVPTAPAAKVFAVFTVLIGYGLLSIATAAIAATFIGEDERGFQRELHRDIRALRHEVAGLRRAIQAMHDEESAEREAPAHEASTERSAR